MGPLFHFFPYKKTTYGTISYCTHLFLLYLLSHSELTNHNAEFGCPFGEDAPPGVLRRAYLTPRNRLYVSMHPKRTQHLPREPVPNGFGLNLVALLIGPPSRGSYPSKYQHLDTGPAGLNIRISSSYWPILDEKLFEW